MQIITPRSVLRLNANYLYSLALRERVRVRGQFKVLDYWLFEKRFECKLLLHASQSFAIFYLRKIVANFALRYFEFRNFARLNWICSTLTEFRLRHFAPVSSICSLSGFHFVSSVRKSKKKLPEIQTVYI